MKPYNMKTNLLLLSLAFMLSSILPAAAQTTVPKGLNYQAAVRDNKGALMASKAVKIRVKFTDKTGATLYWQEDFNITTTANGLANIVLGNGTKSGGSKSTFSDISWINGSPKMEVLLDADGSGNYISMGTNNFWSVPYAMVADSLSKAPKLNYMSDVSKITPNTGQVLKWNGTSWAPANDDTSKSTGGTPTPGGDVSGPLTNLKVIKLQGNGISTTAPTTGQVLKWNGTAWAPAADDTTSHYKLPTPGGDVTGALTSLKVIKIQGNPISTTAPTTGQILKWDGTQWKPADTSKVTTTWLKNGSDIYYSAGNVGINTSTPKNRLHIIETLGSKTEGMRVETSGGSGGTAIYSGIYSETKNSSGLSNGIQGRSTGKTTTGLSVGISGYGAGSSIQNTGVVGFGTGTSTVATNIGVYGRADSTSNVNTGVQGDATWTISSASSASSNTGVWGNASGNSNINNAVFGNSTGTGAQNIGVFGRSSGSYTSTGANYGVAGLASSGPVNYGVYGSAPTSTGSYAGYFSGNVYVSGSLAKSSGSFKIDHPQDPANKYLVHSFVESPDMMNVYNGNISTGADSTATVTLPAYFEALNKDFRYQLTVIGDFAQAIVLKEVSDNTFVIKTSKANIKVSWQVTGIRHDPYAEKNRIVPEEEKTGREKGKYLLPELYGQTQDKAIFPTPR